MDKDIDKIVELGKVLLNTPTLRTIYKDKFEIKTVDFEFVEKSSSSQFTSKYEHYIFRVTLYTDISINFDERIKSGCILQFQPKEFEPEFDGDISLWKSKSRITFYCQKARKIDLR